MSSTASLRTSSSSIACVALALVGCAAPLAELPWSLLYSDDFADTGNWIVEAEKPARIVADRGVLDIDAPAGITLWFRHEIHGDVRIEFAAMAVAAGGPNDQVS